MYPILYEQVSTGVVPEHNGLGVLSDAVKCEIEQVRNGAYQLVMVYPITGIHAQELAQRRFIKAKPNFTDDPQLFRIDRISAVLNGKFTVYAKHVSYDLSGYPISSGEAGSAIAACLLLEGAAGGFSISTDKHLQADFKITEPGSVRSYFGGRQGSFLDVYGPAEIKYNNFEVEFLAHAGQDRHVTIRYGKNLLELSQEIDSSNLYTDVICYYKGEDGTVISSVQVSTGLVLDVPRVLTLDVTFEFQEEPTVSDLNARATRYVNENNLTTPSNNIVLDFDQSVELSNRVDLCDTVTVYYEALGITREKVKCIRTKWDCLRERYIETEFGDARSSLVERITTLSKEVADKPSTSAMEAAISVATSLISGNSGGYVVMHDANQDGKPDEILIMDTDDINTAVKVWRWNASGLGYSGAGYAGPYNKIALTNDGQIVADAITTGVLNADLIKTGVIEDVGGKSQIDMLTGSARLFQLIAKRNVTVMSDDDVTVASLTEIVGGGRALRLYDSTGQIITAILQSSSDKGNLFLRNAIGDTRVQAWIGGNDDGIIDLSNSSGDVTIAMAAARGQIECKRIKPYEVIVGPDGEYGMIGTGPWSVVGADWKIHRMGNIVFMEIPFSGNGASISAGSNAFSGYFSKGAMPIIPVRWSGYYNSTHLDMSIDTSGNIAVRVIGSAINLSSSSVAIICGSFLVDD